MEKRAHKREEHKSHVSPPPKKEERAKVCETYEVDKGNKIEYKTLCGAIEQSHATREEVKRHKKILFWILVGVGVVLVFVASLYLFGYLKAHFEYRGVKYDLIQEKNLLFYKTAFPTMYKGILTDYNFYIRNDPRKLDDQVPFEGTFVLKQDMIIDSEEEFACGGDGVIATANLVKFYSFVGTKVLKDPSAGCDADGKYTFLLLKNSDETNIEQFGPSCYYININNCEVLRATERFMTEGFVYVNDKVGK